MQWKIFLTRAGTEALSEELGMSIKEWTQFLFNEDPTHAIEVGEDARCPQCHREPTQAMGAFFADEPANAPERVKGPVFIKCLCRTWYRYDGIEEVDVGAPIGQATVCAATTTKIQPGTGSLRIEGQTPAVVENVAVTETVAVEITPEPGTGEEPTRLSPPPEPPSRFLTTPPYRQPYGQAAASWTFPGVPPDNAQDRTDLSFRVILPINHTHRAR